MNKASVATATLAVLGACVSSVVAQGSVVGEAQPGTMGSTFTIPFIDYNPSVPSGCGMVYAGCTGTFVQFSHEVAGEVTVIDDCTFRIQGWQFDGLGPAVEWWGSKQQPGNPTKFQYPASAQKIGELGAPGSYQTGSLHGGNSDVVVRLGVDASGAQIEFNDDLNHISLWCEDFAVDFGNAALSCDAAAMGPADTAAAATTTTTPGAGAPGTPGTPGTSSSPGTPGADGADGADTTTAATTTATDTTTRDTTADSTEAAAVTNPPSAAFSMRAAVGALAGVAALGVALL